MLILGIETSCDETSAAVISGNKNDKNVSLISNITATSLPIHAKTGGIIPENAAREQIKFIIPVIDEALKSAGIKPLDLDAISVTNGPGLIGSLLVGVETAKTLSFVWEKPIIPMNHLIGHVYANFINGGEIEFPAIALIISGGHTDLIFLERHGKIKWIGGTRDDAAGEALDKIGRLLNLPYPGGPHIEKEARNGDPKKIELPRPMIGTKDFDFSFSGLKTAVLNEVKHVEDIASIKSDLAASVQETIFDVIVKKTIKAVDAYKAKSLLLSGGVAANQTLKKRFEIEKGNVALSVPPPYLCTDNGAMIATASFFNYNTVPWNRIEANPSLHFD